MTRSIRPLVALAAVLLLTGCASRDPSAIRDASTRIYGDFYPAPGVEVLVEGDVPGLATPALPRLVALYMRTSVTYGIQFDTAGVNRFASQQAIWRFEPTAEGVRVAVRLEERGQRLVETFALLPGTPDATALGNAVAAMTRQLYAAGQVQISNL